ncbi:MAG: LysR family transcriptional regulator [Deltaproteobacteria bacterium]|nr:LysR family transcriptional regulator [Deltaproteobacteria bacterium]MBZ0219588.1 LysR family transcriptional regulator [Deltaproteobacteria bacterium]
MKRDFKKDEKPAGAYTVKGHIWVEGPEGTYLGIGRVILLEMIREYGSITGAARAIDMSYRKAWELVESMNRQAARPLVTASTGGKGGGGAALTAEGEKAIKAFREIDDKFRSFREEMISLLRE